MRSFRAEGRKNESPENGFLWRRPQNNSRGDKIRLPERVSPPHRPGMAGRIEFDFASLNENTSTSAQSPMLLFEVFWGLWDIIFSRTFIM